MKKSGKKQSLVRTTLKKARQIQPQRLELMAMIYLDGQPVSLQHAGMEKAQSYLFHFFNKDAKSLTKLRKNMLTALTSYSQPKKKQ